MTIDEIMRLAMAEYDRENPEPEDGKPSKSGYKRTGRPVGRPRTDTPTYNTLISRAYRERKKRLV